MLVFYNTLGERSRRRYAALEALKLRRGGRGYICGLLGLHSSTLKRAIDELQHPERFKPLPTDKERRGGGGVKKMIQHLRALIEQHKAGSPTNPDVYWVHLKPREIAALYLVQYGEKISNGSVKRELSALGYRYRKMSKNLATGSIHSAMPNLKLYSI